MTCFTYGGVELDLDWVVSYARVSSGQQRLDEGGGGIDRQLDDFRAFVSQFGLQEFSGLGSLVDDGTSGSTGKTLLEGAALHRFIANIKKLPKKCGLVVESFSRLNRLVIDEGLTLFFKIVCENNVPLITLQRQRAYTKRSVRNDRGQMYGVVAEVQASRDLAENISFYSTKGWKTRRGSAANVLPSWIVKTLDGKPVSSVKGLVKQGAKVGLTADPIKSEVVIRIFHMALTMGAGAIAQALNAEGVPVLNERKRKRCTLIWTQGTITKLLRAKSVLGLQEVGEYLDGKREVSGEYRQAYPAVIDEKLWQRVQAKVNARATGNASTGRNQTLMTNLFGDIARCRCGQGMKVFRRGDHGQYAYFGCSAAFAGTCDNRRFYRLDHIERVVLPRVAAEVVDDQPNADPIAKLDCLIAQGHKELAALETQHERSMARTGALAERTQAKLERDFTAKRAAVTKLENERAGLQAVTPASEAQTALRGVLHDALDGSGDVRLNARRIVANALPSLLDALVCSDGVMIQRGRMRAHLAIKKGDKGRFVDTLIH